MIRGERVQRLIRVNTERPRRNAYRRDVDMLDGDGVVRGHDHSPPLPASRLIIVHNHARLWRVDFKKTHRLCRHTNEVKKTKSRQLCAWEGRENRTIGEKGHTVCISPRSCAVPTQSFQ